MLSRVEIINKRGEIKTGDKMPENGKLRIVKEPEGKHRIEFGISKEAPNWDYVCDFDAEDFGNIKMDPEQPYGEGLEWPPTPNRGYHLEGTTALPRGDAFRTTKIERIKVATREGSDVSLFDVIYRDETIERPKERTLAKKRSDYKLWRGPLGIEPRLRPAFVYNGLAFIRRLLP